MTDAELLRATHLVDRSAMLRPGGRRMVEAAMARLRLRGRTARLLLGSRPAEAPPLGELWAAAGLEPARDLLLLYDGREWSARGWSLAPDAIDAALASARPAARQTFARGLVAALDALAEAAESPADPGRAAARPGPHGRGSVAPWGWWVGGLGVGLAALGVTVLWRRRARLASQRGRV